MEKLIVTGADGFFASRFIEYYKEKYDIVALGHKELDITDEKKVMEIIQKQEPKFVINAAAISDTTICERNPELSYEINVKGPVNIAKACYKNSVKMIHLSSDQVYNGSNGYAPYDEETILKPNTVYGRHKCEAEDKIMWISEESLILRLTWLYGYPEKNKKTNANIISNIIDAVTKSEPISLRANEYRGFTYVYDLLQHFEKIINVPYGIYNFGSENNLSTYEIGKLVFKAMGLEHKIDELLIKDTESFKDKKRDLRIDTYKLKKEGINFEHSKIAINRCIIN